MAYLCVFFAIILFCSYTDGLLNDFIIPKSVSLSGHYYGLGSEFGSEIIDINTFTSDRIENFLELKSNVDELLEIDEDVGIEKIQETYESDIYEDDEIIEVLKTDEGMIDPLEDVGIEKLQETYESDIYEDEIIEVLKADEGIIVPLESNRVVQEVEEALNTLLNIFESESDLKEDGYEYENLDEAEADAKYNYHYEDEAVVEDED